MIHRRSSMLVQPKLVLLMWNNGNIEYYPNKSLNKQRIEIHESCRIFKNSKTCTTKFMTLEQVKKGKAPLKDYSLVVSMNIINKGEASKKFVINKPCSYINTNMNQQVFMSLKSYYSSTGYRGYQLKQGDLIRVGNNRIRVIQIAINKSQQQQEQDQFQDYRKASNSFHFNSIRLQGACRICLSQETSQDDFLMTPCECKGSCSNVHFSCLKKWMETKVAVNNDRRRKVTCYSFKKFSCQICKSFLPKCIVNNRAIHYLFGLQSSTQSHQLILQIEGQPYWHVVTIKKNESVQLGRSLASDIIMSSPSVSKIHAQITMEMGKFYLKDLYSENGTFVKLKEQFQIKSSAHMLIGKTHYELHIE